MSDQLHTASRLRAFRSCPRKEHYQYALGIRTPSSPAQEFGTAAHSALEAYFRAWKEQDEQAADDDQRVAAAFDSIATVHDPVDAIRLRALLAAYHVKYGNEDWEIIAVEEQFRFYLGRLEFGGKIDALIRERSTGRALVLEHKTSTQDTSPGSLYWDRLALDTQISLYLDGCEFGLDVPVVGCVYDVLKRPLHEPLQATPADQVGYTIGKGCKSCGGSAKNGEIAQGRGHLIVNFGSVVEQPECGDCKGTGWRCDKEGIPQAPRPYAKTRLTDESLEEFEERLTSEIATRHDDYLQRGTIVRLDSELPKMRAELIDTALAMEVLRERGLYPPNHDACTFGREACAFFGACAGRASIDDPYLFPRGVAHPELVQPTRVA